MLFRSVAAIDAPAPRVVLAENLPSGRRTKSRPSFRRQAPTTSLRAGIGASGTKLRDDPPCRPGGARRSRGTARAISWLGVAAVWRVRGRGEAIRSQSGVGLLRIERPREKASPSPLPARSTTAFAHAPRPCARARKALSVQLELKLCVVAPAPSSAAFNGDYLPLLARKDALEVAIE